MTKILNQIRERGILYPSVKGRIDSFPVSIPSGEVFHSCRLTILNTHLGGDARIAAQPAAGQAGKAEVRIEWQGEASATIQYQVEAFSSPSSDLSAAGKESITRQMTDFLPSINGFHFRNQFEAVPPLKLIGELKYGDASKGMCGGMVYAALDYFNAGLEIPQILNEDISLRYGSPLHGPIFEYIGKRLFGSFDLPVGVLNFIELMQPDFPDSQVRRGHLGLPPRSRAWRMVRQEWPTIKRKLDTGQPCPLGLVRVKTTEIAQLGKNHQVLAYGYDLVGDNLTLFIYDPNYPDKNDITLKLNIGDPEHKTNVTYSDGEEVYCFFHTNYTFSLPPSNQPSPGRIILFEGEDFCGKSINVVHAQADLTLFKEGNFNDRTSSITILSGNWSFYRDPHFETPFMHGMSPMVLSPGPYTQISSLGIPDNEISSLKEVAGPPNY